MSTPLASKPDDEHDPNLIPEGPPEEEFWERYNKRLEFPISTVAAVLLHVMVVALLAVTFMYLMKNVDKSAVPVSLVPDMGGLDDEGTGQAGSGGANDPLKVGKANPFSQQDVLPSPQDLPAIRDMARQKLNLDDAGDTPISDFNAKSYAEVDKALLDKLMNPGVRKGDGPGQGTGSDNTKGAGPGGTGASSTRARSLRWVMRFSTSDGQDYVNQLASLGAVILVPLPPDYRECLYFTDLKNPSRRRKSTEDDLRQLAGQIKFIDTRPSSVGGVCAALGVTEPARSFWVFFPKGLEDQLAQKETGYRNRRAEDIEETIFRVITRGGGYEIVVDDQTPKR